MFSQLQGAFDSVQELLRSSVVGTRSTDSRVIFALSGVVGVWLGWGGLMTIMFIALDALFLQKVKALLADKWSNDATTNFSTVVRFDFAGGMGRKTRTKPAKSGTTR